jgi:hypothetical protein
MRELGIVLPPVFPPVGNYLGCVVDGDLVWVGGHGPEGERGSLPITRGAA